MSVEPYPFIRAVTLSLATFWSLRTVVRTIRFLDRWERRLEPIGIRRRWLRRQVVRIMLRASLFDPINLALLIALITVWVV